jgi:hypothetical protein
MLLESRMTSCYVIIQAELYDIDRKIIVEPSPVVFKVAGCCIDDPAIIVDVKIVIKIFRFDKPLRI